MRNELIDLDALRADPDFPPGVVIKALRNGEYNLTHARTDTHDQWQFATDPDDDFAAVLEKAVTQHDRAAGRIEQAADQRARQAIERAAQEAYREKRRAWRAGHKQRMAQKAQAIRARHGKPGQGGA